MKGVPLTTVSLKFSVEAHECKLELHVNADQAKYKMVSGLAVVVNEQKVVNVSPAVACFQKPNKVLKLFVNPFGPFVLDPDISIPEELQ